MCSPSSSVSTEFGPERRLEHRRVRLAGVELRRVAGEDLLDERRVGDVDDAAEVREPDAEDVAVAALEPDEEAERVARVAQALDDSRQPRAGREGVAGRDAAAGSTLRAPCREGYATRADRSSVGRLDRNGRRRIARQGRPAGAAGRARGAGLGRGRRRRRSQRPDRGRLSRACRPFGPRARAPRPDRRRLHARAAVRRRLRHQPLRLRRRPARPARHRRARARPARLLGGPGRPPAVVPVRGRVLVRRVPRRRPHGRPPARQRVRRGRRPWGARIRAALRPHPAAPAPRGGRRQLARLVAGPRRDRADARRRRGDDQRSYSRSRSPRRSIATSQTSACATRSPARA